MPVGGSIDNEANGFILPTNIIQSSTPYSEMYLWLAISSTRFWKKEYGGTPPGGWDPSRNIAYPRLIQTLKISAEPNCAIKIEEVGQNQWSANSQTHQNSGGSALGALLWADPQPESGKLYLYYFGLAGWDSERIVSLRSGSVPTGLTDFTGNQVDRSQGLPIGSAATGPGFKVSDDHEGVWPEMLPWNPATNTVYPDQPTDPMRSENRWRLPICTLIIEIF